jgi:putative ABC transport system substrate-binding protein
MKFVENLARPGGNATGLANFGSDIAGKRLQLLQELVPGLTRVGLLANSNQEVSRLYAKVTSAAADQLRLTLQQFEAHSLEEMEPALDAMVNAGMQAMTVTQGGTAFQARHVIPKLALARSLPMSAISREYFEEGALFSYGADQIEMCRRSAIYADKILKGAQPAELPVEQPTKLELLINLRTAKALGLNVPPQLQQLADEVIE